MPFAARINFRDETSYSDCIFVIQDAEQIDSIRLSAIVERGRDKLVTIELTQQQATQLIAHLAKALLRGYPEESPISK